MRSKLLIAVVLCLAFCPSLASAEVAKVTVANRVTVAGGQAFGTTGPYEKLTGTIEFALDPKEPHNARITDLGRAPQDARGRVHFTSDMMVLRPTDPAKGNGVLLFEVINRGRLGLLDRFNSADGADDPVAPADFGNGYLMREGYTLVFVGWQFDIRPPQIRVEAPAIDGLIEAIKVRFLPDAKANEAALNDARCISPVNAADAASTLTVRDHYWDTPTPIERAKWHFVAGQQGAPRLALDGGFEAGRLYEVTYKATGARVAGVGLAAIRDAASAFRYRTDLPVQGKTAYVFGASQDGRFLREFLYDGFNADERDRRVFDAVWAHIAGAARGNFNERFGMPVSQSVFSPTRFPFTTEEETLNGERGALLGLYKPDQRPKLFLSNTPVEHWGGGRAAALIHTSPDGKKDVPRAERRPHLLSVGHTAWRIGLPPMRTRGQQMANPVPQREVMRALMRGLHGWVSQGTAPPDSRYPKLADGTLTPVAAVTFPRYRASPIRASFPARRRPETGRTEMLPYLVPQVDADGNDVAGIRVPDISVPVATNTGWNFRAEAIGSSTSEVYNNMGSTIPFAHDEGRPRGAARSADIDRRSAIAIEMITSRSCGPRRRNW